MDSRYLASDDRHPRYAIALVVIAWSIGTLPQSLAAGNATTGRQLYQARCVGCHGDGSNSRSSLGPNLAGIVSRKAGTGEGGVHSRAMTESNIRWDEASLRWFLAGPTKQLEGTTMPASVPDSQQIEDLIAYLKTLH